MAIVNRFIVSPAAQFGEDQGMDTNTVYEAARHVPVVGEYDLCVLGGSCTGVFAAVRAARLGLSVALVEQMGCFGGVATSSLVNVWHSPFDTEFKQRIIGGLTVEVMERLAQRNAVTVRENCPHWHWAFNSAQLQIELDTLVCEHGITPWLHTSFVSAVVEDGELRAVIVENKSGRSALRARFFIDATGDGDLCHRLGLESHRQEHRQPSTTCAIFDNWRDYDQLDWQQLIRRHGSEYGLPDGFCWGVTVPGTDAYMLAGTRVYQDCSDAAALTQASIEGRRQVRAIGDLLRKYAPEPPAELIALPARIGVRETRHIRCLHRLTADEVLYGVSFADTIANGSYRVDVHHDDKPGLTFRYLDGREVYIRPGYPAEQGHWREPLQSDPLFYQIPYRCLVPAGAYGNLLAAGRFIDADEQAHGAIRVMVTMNQTGEAAGVAAALALRSGRRAAAIDTDELRAMLVAGGSVLLPA